MLLNIHPRLSPDALWALSAMGHGDEVIVADANFPGEAVARQSTFGKLVRMDCESVEALEAVLSVMPIDTFIDDAAGRMEVVGAPDEIPEVQTRVLPLLLQHTRQVVGIERYAFYARAKKAFLIIQTMEPLPYGCFVLSKGVIAPR